MSTAVMMASIEETSPRPNARLGGLFWLLTILTGIFSMVAVNRTIVFGDAAGTAANILAHESTFRMGIAANILATACYLAATLFVYDLLRPVNRSVSLLAMLFSMTGCAMGAISSLFHLAPLVLLGGAQYLSVFNVAQVRALAFTFIRLHVQTANLGFAFFGLHCLLVGRLIVRSTFLPRAVGELMTLAGIGWLITSFANVLSPSFARTLTPYIMIPGMLGETSLTLWLLVKGVDVQRWKEQAGS
jgi:hypothetical protein